MKTINLDQTDESSDWIKSVSEDKEIEKGEKKSFRNELADLEEQGGITANERHRDEPPPSSEGDPETYGKNETP